VTARDVRAEEVAAMVATLDAWTQAAAAALRGLAAGAQRARAVSAAQEAEARYGAYVYSHPHCRTRSCIASVLGDPGRVNRGDHTF
jgi:hypothetical protein